MKKVGRSVVAMSAVAVIVASMGVFDAGAGVADDGESAAAADDQPTFAPVGARAMSAVTDGPSESADVDGPPELAGPEVPRWPLDSDTVEVRDTQVGVPVVLTLDVPEAGGLEGYAGIESPLPPVAT